MHAVGDMTDGYFMLRPTGKQGEENTTADLSMQAADAIHPAATAQGEISHVKGVTVIAIVSMSQGKKCVHGDVEMIGVI